MMKSLYICLLILLATCKPSNEGQDQSETLGKKELTTKQKTTSKLKVEEATSDFARNFYYNVKCSRDDVAGTHYALLEDARKAARRRKKDGACDASC